jgi:hypothetical protein
MSYDASAVKIYNATGSLMSLENKKYFLLLWRTVLVYYNAGVDVVNRVTRWVLEKFAQNVVQRIKTQTESLTLDKSRPKMLASSLILKNERSKQKSKNRQIWSPWL